jgi:hypothetical protein
MGPGFRHVAPGRLQIREGGGCLSVFGVPFLAAGVIMILMALGIVPVTNASELPEFGWLLLPFMGAMFALVGGALVFGRSWTTLDITERLVIKEWGLLRPMRRRTHRLEDYTAVTLGFQAGDSDSSDRFPVSLKARSGPNLPLWNPTQYGDARACAAAVAQHLQLEIEDASTGHASRLSAAHADVPLRERLRLDSEIEADAPRPADARSEISPVHDGVRIVIPRPRMHPIVFAVALIPVAIVLIVVEPLHQFFRQTRTPDVVGWIFLGFLLFGFAFLPAITAWHAFRRSRVGRTIVTASSEGVRIEERGAWRTKTLASFSASEILDVDFSTSESLIGSARLAADQHRLKAGDALQGSSAVSPRTERILAALSRFAKGKGVTIKTRQGLTTFAEGLGDQEIRYLHSIVRRALAGNLRMP